MKNCTCICTENGAHNGTQRVNHFPFFVLCSAKGKKAPGSTRRPVSFFLLPLNLNLSLLTLVFRPASVLPEVLRSVSLCSPGILPVHRYKSLAVHSGAYIIRQQPNALPLMQPVARTRSDPIVSSFAFTSWEFVLRSLAHSPTPSNNKNRKHSRLS